MKRILIVKLWALGDILMATPLLAALRNRFPDVMIDWVVDAVHADILRDHPMIANLVVIDTGRWRRKLRRGDVWNWGREAVSLRTRLAAQSYDAVINCHPEKWWSAVLCPAPRRIALYPSTSPGVEHAFYTSIVLRNRSLHNTRQYLEAAKALGAKEPFDERMILPVRENERLAASDWLQSHLNYNPSLPDLILHPGTSQPSKCWPTRNFAEVARHSDGTYNIIVTASPKEESLVHEIIRYSGLDSVIPAVFDRVGKIVPLIERAAAVVTGDTSILHIASAVGTPMVGIYGSTRPSDNAPLFGEHDLLFDDSVSCAPCLLGTCPLSGEHYLRCQRAIVPAVVVQSLNKITAVSVSK